MMIAAILLARHFDTSEFASYGYLQLTIAMLATYAAMGLGPASSKLFAVHAQTSTSSTRSSVIGELWLGSVLVSIIAAGVVLLLPLDWMRAGLGLPRWLLAAGVLVMTLHAVPGGAVLGLEEFPKTALVSVGTSVVMLTGTVVAVAIDSIQVAMMTLLAAMLAQTIGTSYVVLQRVGWACLTIRHPVDWHRVRQVLDLSLPLAANGMIAATGTWVLGRIILLGSGGEHAFALYMIGMQWFSLALFLPGNMGSVFLPTMVKHAIDKSDGRVQLRKVVAATVAASLTTAIIGVAVSPMLLQMYGDNFQIGSWVIGAYMGAAIVAAPVVTLGNALLANGGQWQRLALMLLWGMVLVGSGLATRDNVMYGGAIAVASAYASLSTVMFVVARRMGIA